MRTMENAKKCGSIKSMRHVTSRPFEDKSVPHLTLYVQQMNKTKLLKERQVLMNRLDEVTKQLMDIDAHILELRPKLGLPEPKRGRRKKGDGGQEARRQGSKEARKIKRMKMTF